MDADPLIGEILKVVNVLEFIRNSSKIRADEDLVELLDRVDLVQEASDHLVLQCIARNVVELEMGLNLVGVGADVVDNVIDHGLDSHIASVVSYVVVDAQVEGQWPEDHIPVEVVFQDERAFF